METLIIRRGFSKERMSRLSAWRCLCDCINMKAIVVPSEHLMGVAQQKLLIWDAAFHHQQRYPSASTGTGAPLVPCPPLLVPTPFPVVGHSINRGAQRFPVEINCARIISSGNAGFG